MSYKDLAITHAIQKLSTVRCEASWRMGDNYRRTRKGEWDKVVEDVGSVLRELENSLVTD